MSPEKIKYQNALHYEMGLEYYKQYYKIFKI